MEHQGLDSREKILMATQDLLMEYGVEGTTTKLIAQRAGVNPVTVFRIFKTKEALLFEIVTKVASDELTKLKVVLEKDFTSIESFFHELNATAVESFLVSKKTFPEIMNGNADLGNDFFNFCSSFLLQAAQLVATKLARLQEQGLLRKVDFMDLTFCHFTLCMGATSTMDHNNQTLLGKSIQRSIEDMTQLLIKGLKP